MHTHEKRAVLLIAATILKDNLDLDEDAGGAAITAKERPTRQEGYDKVGKWVPQVVLPLVMRDSEGELHEITATFSYTKRL